MQLENSLLKLAPNRVFQYLLIYLFLILFAGITFMHLMRPVVKNKKKKLSNEKAGNVGNLKKKQESPGQGCRAHHSPPAATMTELQREPEFSDRATRRWGHGSHSHHSEGSCFPISQRTQRRFWHENIK